MMVSGVFKGIWRKTRSIRECIRRKLSNIGPLGILWSYKKTIANGKKVYVRLMKRYGANTEFISNTIQVRAMFISHVLY